MKGQDKYSSYYSGDIIRRNSWDDPGFEILLSPRDSALFEKISDYMKGMSDIEDVKTDPAYSITNEEVKVMISDYQKKTIRNEENEKFIRDSCAEESPEEKLNNEVSQIKDEISRSNINNITSEWVKEWHEKRHRNNIKDSKTEEIRNFITGSLKLEEISAEMESDEKIRSGFSKPMIIKYTSLAAAAIIGAVFLIRSLLPSVDPQKMFSKYYEPFNAVSSITRNIGPVESDNFTRAIISYQAGDYKTAATGFSEAMLNRTESFSAGFFLGLTEIELGNYSKAIDLLGGVVNRKSEFTKEATWYLGLVYIKSGNMIKAKECFELLARSPGFYSNRSEKILHLLK